MNTFIKDNWFKLSIAVAVLLVAISAGYYFIIFVPNNERSKVERAQDKETQQAQEKQAVELQQQQESQTNAILLQQCLANAVESYNADWKANCIDVAQITEKSNSDWNKKCLSDRQTNYNNCLAEYSSILGTGVCQKYLTIGDCDTLLGAADYSADCSLPKARADSLNGQLKDSKADCYKQYPQ